MPSPLLRPEGIDLIALVTPPTAGNDSLQGTMGRDVIEGLAGDDQIFGMAERDRLFGGDGNDLIIGAGGTDDLRGEVGRDSLSGGTGADDLAGGDGADRLDGGADNDELQGDAGADRFIFQGAFGHDVIEDFRDGRDIIALPGRGLTFADLTFVPVNGGQDLRISLGPLSSITLEDFDQGALRGRMFDFG